MFTGIIETLGQVKEITSLGTNKSYWIESPLSTSFTIDQSISHDGVCLTIEDLMDGLHKVTAVAETLHKTNLEYWKPGRIINLERSLLPNTRLDGHFVQGHADTTGCCKDIINKNGSYEVKIKCSKKYAPLFIEKGSICINGISLTTFDVTKNGFCVAIIPYTFNNTNLQYLTVNDEVNLEFDMIGKYILRKLSLDK